MDKAGAVASLPVSADARASFSSRHAACRPGRRPPQPRAPLTYRTYSTTYVPGYRVVVHVMCYWYMYMILYLREVPKICPRDRRSRGSGRRARRPTQARPRQSCTLARWHAGSRPIHWRRISHCRTAAGGAAGSTRHHYHADVFAASRRRAPAAVLRCAARSALQAWRQ